MFVRRARIVLMRSQNWPRESGSLVGLGATALLFSLFLPRGIWGSLEDRFGVRLLPVGYRLKSTEANAKPPEP
jgi:hypothetical protein